MAITDSNDQIGQALRVVLPVVYIIIAIISVIGNLIALQIICANRFRHKSYHMLICSIISADLLFTVIFMIIRSVSYAHLHANWFINVEQWCKAEMYLLKLFDFILAYTIVFLCIDRVVSPNTCCFAIRRLRSGFIIAISIWISSAYILIPILLFGQRKIEHTFGGYMCSNKEESVQLFWLSANPRRILDFLDFLSRIIIPIFFMFVLTLAICYRNDLKLFMIKNKSNKRPASAVITSSSIETEHEIQKNLYPKKLNYMIISYVLVFAVCQLPYEIYRATMLWNHEIELNLSENSIVFAIEIPLLILKLINRAVNPFLFMCLADDDKLRQKCFRLWCIPCIPGCNGCQNCWCKDCYESIRYEINYCVGATARDDNLLQAYLDDDHLANTNTHIPIYTATKGSSTMDNEHELSITNTNNSVRQQQPSRAASKY